VNPTSLFGELDLHLISEGRHERLWELLGSHVRRSTSGEIVGTTFAVWAPNAQSVTVIGDHNYWDKTTNPMVYIGSGIWELFVPGINLGSKYKYAVLGKFGIWVDHADPFAQECEIPPSTASIVTESSFVFSDDEWLKKRAGAKPWSEAISIYEVHLGSWKPGLGYKELAVELLDYLQNMGFTHVEFLPLCAHPFEPSWGYQVTSFYAPTPRFGSPDELRYLINQLHLANIGIILDWVPAHFPRDEWALAQFDGTALYEHEDPRLGEHPDWGTLIFNYDRKEVRNFLVASALYWLEEFHVDGIRVDAVASMLYLDYSRQADQWIPNIFGGRENLGAVSFLKELNATCYTKAPGIMMIAEESTSWPGVTKTTSADGLGFGFKWNMGWMHDTLQYIQEDPINRVYHHDEITKPMLYAFSENFILPYSHDEVVHGKGSMVAKIPGDRWQKLATLRALYGFMWAQPGKKLLFMGCEFAQSDEWKAGQSLDWHLTDFLEHQGIQETVRSLNTMYAQHPALWEIDTEQSGFTWLVVDDRSANVLAFARSDRNGDSIVCISNFSPVPHNHYKLHLPIGKTWKVVLNTDDNFFGGSGFNVNLTIDKERNESGISIPPLATVWLSSI
jgi:1,4-alpha-glucan branching enzyme